MKVYDSVRNTNGTRKAFFLWYTCVYFTDTSFIDLRVWMWVVVVNVKLSSSKCSAYFPFSVPSNLCHCSGLAWSWSGEVNAHASMLWHRDYDRWAQSICCPSGIILPTYAGDSRTREAIALRGVKIIPGPRAESCSSISMLKSSQALWKVLRNTGSDCMLSAP